MVDDRGKQVALLHERFFIDDMRIAKAERDAIRARLKDKRGTQIVGTLVFTLPGMIVVIASIFLAQSSTMVLFVAAGVGLPAGIALMTVPQLVISRRIGHKRLAAVCAQLRLCSSCGYNLQYISRESDGCTVCPECGAAWRVAGLKDAPVATGSLADGSTTRG